MELSYFNWLLLKEMGSHTVSDTSNVNFIRRPRGLDYNFVVNGKPYEVHFSGPGAWQVWPEGSPNVINLANKVYSIGFSREGSHTMPGDTKLPTAVYGEVFKAIRKLIEEENPDAFRFYGAYEKQDSMYDSFYKKYLSKLFTRIGAEGYLRNDLYNKYKEENGPAWQAIQIEDKQESPYLIEKLAKAKKQRDADREKRRQLKQGGVTSTATAMQQPRGWTEVPAGGGSEGGYRSPIQRLGLRRGERVPNGGYYVGTTPAGIDWVAYSNDEYDALVSRFDGAYGRPGGSQ